MFKLSELLVMNIIVGELRYSLGIEFNSAVRNHNVELEGPW